LCGSSRTDTTHAETTDNELPLAWITSYLSECSASVLFHSSRSHWRSTPLSYPRYQCLGIYSTILFTADIGPLFASCCLASHSYANDIQTYKHCLASQAHSAIRIVLHATDTLNAWMSSNRLLLNPQKSQYIWFGTRQQLDKLDLVALSLEFPTFVFSTSVRDLGVILDQELSFVDHITVLTRSSFYHLHQLWVVSCSLTSFSTATLVHAFIVNRLDHCSTLYCGVPQVRLQMAFLGRLLGCLAAFPSLDISVNSCEIHSTGTLSGSVFTIGSPPLFGVVSLALCLHTYWSSSS